MTQQELEIELAAQKAFKDGVEYQKQQMYSYIEVLEILSSYADWSINGDCNYYEWLKQYKKVF